MVPTKPFAPTQTKPEVPKSVEKVNPKPSKPTPKVKPPNNPENLRPKPNTGHTEYRVKDSSVADKLLNLANQMENLQISVPA